MPNKKPPKENKPVTGHIFFPEAEPAKPLLKLHVLIHRQRDYEDAPGTLRAWVVQNGVKGTVLVKGSKSIDATKTAAVKLLPSCEIEWEIEQ